MTAAESFESFFDHVHVVSLPASHDRRAYVAQHLRAAGIENFEFHDACDETDPRVLEIIASERVHRYPPCFRCGKLSCGRDDCNNVLIPSQIATFVTYLELWKKIAARPQFSLVVEDDVELNPYWPEVLRKLTNAKSDGQLDLSPDKPRLLRLGWARNDDHDPAVPFRISHELRMSNPCHALTSAFAKALLDRFDKIDTTVDIFMHKNAPKPGEALTVFPPLASELSWSKGAFDSLIHPKPVRAEYLERSGRREEAAVQRQKINRHRKHIFHRKFLVVGHPRTGTGFAASLMRQLGLDIGHETDGSDGVSSWMMSVDDPENPWAGHPIASSRSRLHWDFCVHPVRKITDAIPSIMREDQYAPVSKDFRRRHILKLCGVDLAGCKSDFEHAVQSLVCWSRIIHATRPDLHFRIEEDAEILLDFLRTKGIDVSVKPGDLVLSPVNENKLYKGKRYPKPDISREDWDALPEQIWQGVVWYCETFGYPLPGRD